MSEEEPQNQVSPEQEVNVNVKVTWGDTSQLPTILANQISLHQTDGVFHLTFGDLQRPVVINPGDLPEVVEVRPIVRLAIPMVRMREITEAMANNLRRFDELSSSEED